MDFLKVYNLNADSFSDGGSYFDSASLESIIQKDIELGLRHFDFGAESTAPFNDAITVEEELSRLEKYLFPLVEKKIFPDDSTISIDTYHGETFKNSYQKIREYYPNIEIWWNDVAGVLHEDDWETLKSLDQNTTYVFCHTNVTDRLKTSQHMEFVKADLKPDEFLKEISEKFVTFQFNWNFKGVSSKLILDPCFGFSKTKEQNYQLIKGLYKVFKNVSGDVPILLGLSRKSFLRSIVTEIVDEELSREQLNEKTEVMHWQLIQKLGGDLRNRKIYIRGHDSLYFLLTQKLWNHVNII